MSLSPKPAAACRFDLVSLGEVMLRLDPGDGRVHTARAFRSGRAAASTTSRAACKRCFGLRHGGRDARSSTTRSAAWSQDLILPGRRRPVATCAG